MIQPLLTPCSAGPLNYAAAEDLPLHALNKLPYGKLAGARIGVKEGVIFLTFSSLISSSGGWVGGRVAG